VRYRGALNIYEALRGFSPTNRYGLVIILIALTYVVTAAMHGSSAQSVVVLVQLLTVWLVFTVSSLRWRDALPGSPW
jgi:hypothetical protein